MITSATLRLAGAMACVMFVAIGSAQASAISIEYDLVSLGGNQYEYRYTLGNVSLGQRANGFSIDFDTSLYDEQSLTIASSALGDWSDQILRSVLPNPAQYDAYNLAGTGPAIGERQSGFAVDFTWLGAGAPSGQSFVVYDPTTFDVLDSGVTTAVTSGNAPEPGTAALALVALVALVGSSASAGFGRMRQMS